MADGYVILSYDMTQSCPLHATLLIKYAKYE